MCITEIFHWAGYVSGNVRYIIVSPSSKRTGITSSHSTLSNIRRWYSVVKSWCK
jgi:hypothetical protein